MKARVEPPPKICGIVNVVEGADVVDGVGVSVGLGVSASVGAHDRPAIPKHVTSFEHTGLHLKTMV